MRVKPIFILPFVSVLLIACNSDDDKLDISEPYTVSFSESEQQFSAIFSDYPISTTEQNNEEFYQLEAAHKMLPSPFDTTKGWYLQGNNHSDDLLMAIKGAVTGLDAQTLYKVSLSATFTTSVPSNCFGIGGAPGESVYVKLGATTSEPINESDELAYHRLNVDIGSQSNSGTQGHAVGNIANGVDCMNEEEFKEKQFTTETTIDVMTDDLGRFWLIAGSDSGFEGLTYFYINNITANISR